MIWDFKHCLITQMAPRLMHANNFNFTVLRMLMQSFTSANSIGHAHTYPAQSNNLKMTSIRNVISYLHISKHFMLNQ